MGPNENNKTCSSSLGYSLVMRCDAGKHARTPHTHREAGRSREGRRTVPWHERIVGRQEGERETGWKIAQTYQTIKVSKYQTLGKFGRNSGLSD